MPTQQDVQRLIALREARRRGMMGPTQTAALQEIERRMSMSDQVAKVAEPAMTIASSMVAEPLSGLAGIAGTILPGPQGQGADWVNRTQKALTYMPRTEGGMQSLQGLASLMQPVSDVMQGAEQGMGDFGYENFGPGVGAMMAAIPAAASEVAGVGKPARAARRGDDVVDAAKRMDIPDMPSGRVMNTESGSKLTFVETTDGHIQMYNPNREKWTDVTDSPIAENIKRKDAEISQAGGTEAYERNIEDIRRQREESVRQYREEAKAQSDDYKVQHTAPMLGDNPAASDLSSVMPDVYRPDAKQYHGTGASYDDKALNVIRKMKGRPNAEVTVYRAVPEGVDDINAGDWVTTTREYARDHIGGDEGYKIISKRVRAKELANDGNSIHEFGFDPGK